MTDYEIALISVGGTLLGAFVGGLISLYQSDRSSRRTQRLEENRRLINTFTTELSDIYPTVSYRPGDIDSFPKKKFPILQAAIREFRFSLPKSDWPEFDSAWRRYYCATGREVDRESQSYLHYCGFTNSDSQTQEHEPPQGLENLKMNVDRILEFATKT